MSRKSAFLTHARLVSTPSKSPKVRTPQYFDSLDLDGVLESLCGLSGTGICLGTHNSTSPVSPALLVLVCVSLLDGGDELGKLRLVLGADLGESEDSSGLLVDDCAETSLTLDNGVWDTHLAAESWQENDQLDWVNIVGDEDEGCLLVLNKTNNVVETVLDDVWLLGDVLTLLALSDAGGLLGETLLLLGLGLWSVFSEEFEDLGGLIAVEDVLELSNRWWDLQSHVEDLALALEADILGPLHHAGNCRLSVAVYKVSKFVVVRLRDGWMSWPMPKLRVRFSMRGF